jgi:hypothetical protein
MAFGALFPKIMGGTGALKNAKVDKKHSDNLIF